MRKTNIKLLGVLLLSAIAMNAQAKVHEKGAYIEGNIGTLYASVNLFGLQYGQFGSFGVNTNGGYQFSKHVAAELGYTNYGLGLNNVDIAAKFIMPIRADNNDFTLFTKIGPAYVFTNDGDGSLIPMLGVGASYGLSDNLDATIQAQGVTVGFFSLGLVSTGLTYHFD